MAQWTSYDTVGKKEDVSDIISNLSPTRTPFISAIGTEKVHNTLYQWQEDDLRAVQDNAFVEGFTATDVALTPTRVRTNTTQIFSRTIKVAGSVDSIDHYGRAKESAYQMSKAMAEVKRDLEYALIGKDQLTQVLGDAVTPRRFINVFGQIDPTMLVKTGAPATPISEANLLSSLQVVWNAGAEVTTAMVTSDDALVISDFAKAAGRYREITNGSHDKELINKVDLYVSPVGTVSVTLNRWLQAGNSLIYDPSNWKLVTFRNWFRETLAKDGDNTKMMVVGEFGLKHKNFKASAYVRRTA